MSFPLVTTVPRGNAYRSAPAGQGTCRTRWLATCTGDIARLRRCRSSGKVCIPTEDRRNEPLVIRFKKDVKDKLSGGVVHTMPLPILVL